jgi:hypothetical protein
MRVMLYLSLLTICAIYALRRGGAPERTTTVAIILMVASDPLVHAVTPSRYSSLDPGHLVIDSLALAAFMVIALRANRYWPLWVSAFQLIAVVAHAGRLLDVEIHKTAYGLMQVLWSYPMLVVLALGTRAHQARLRQYGVDPSWSGSLRPAGPATPPSSPIG